MGQKQWTDGEQRSLFLGKAEENMIINNRNRHKTRRRPGQKRHAVPLARPPTSRVEQQQERILTQRVPALVYLHPRHGTLPARSSPLPRSCGSRTPPSFAVSSGGLQSRRPALDGGGLPLLCYLHTAHVVPPSSTYQPTNPSSSSYPIHLFFNPSSAIIPPRCRIYLNLITLPALWWRRMPPPCRGLCHPFGSLSAFEVLCRRSPPPAIRVDPIRPARTCPACRAQLRHVTER
ncbi:hypothetical protein C8J57DRAFT_1233950 [Mycena rebaudengoi]|nr:hypothetical protein C8J57DRAFT_1233950 [Mycena rebaudengoi]